MTYATLFDVPPHQPHSETSRDAAQSVAPKTESLREQVYNALRCSPMTDEQIAVRLSLNPSTSRPRRVELVKAGRIVEVGKAPTASGRTAVLWGVVLSKDHLD
jgi:predicted ArsR family transcriptional regulator